MAKEKLVKIIWRDISNISSPNSNASAWLNKKNILVEAQKLYDMEYISVGLLIHETDEYIVIAATTDDDENDPQYAEASMIMKSVIKRIENLNSEKTYKSKRGIRV